MPIEARIIELRHFLEANKLHRTFMLIISQRTLILARYEQINELSDKLRGCLLHIDTTNTISHVVKTQVTQLDLISKIFMLLEDYLSYSNLFKKELSDLPDKIASKGGQIGAEIEYLKSMSEDDIRKYLLMPEPSELQLSSDEKQLAEAIFDMCAKDTLDRIKRVVTFSTNYYRVYIKFKHSFSVILGMHNRTGPNSFGSHIWVRDSEGDAGVQSYAIPVDINTLEYYQQVTEDITKVFARLNFAYMNHLQNRCKPFLSSSYDFVPEDKKEVWATVVNRVNYYIEPEPTAMFKFEFQNESLKRLQQDTRANFVHKISEDVLSWRKIRCISA